MNDLENDLRTMLHDRADAVTPAPDARAAIERRITTGAPADVVPLDSRRRRSNWVPAAAAAAAIAVVALVAGSVGSDSGPAEVSVASQPPAPAGDPDDLPGSDDPIFGVGAGYADPNEAAADYLGNRGVGPALAVEEALVDGDEAVVRYASYQQDPGGDAGIVELGSGSVHLWDSGEGWVVRVAVADGVVVERAAVSFVDDAADLLEVEGQVAGDGGALSIRVTSPAGDSLLPDEGRPRNRAPLRGAPTFSGEFRLAPSAGHTQVVVEVTGGTVFAVTEFSLPAPPRPLWRLPAGSDPVEGASEFVSLQGWTLEGEAQRVDGADGLVSVGTRTGEVHVVFAIDGDGRVVITGAWDELLDHPDFVVRDGEVSGRWQAPVAGDATVAITPFFSEFADLEVSPTPVVAGEVRHGPSSHPSNGFEPVIVEIRLRGIDGIERRAFLTV